MVQKVKAYFKTLEDLTTEALDRSAEETVRAEKRNVALVIAHIAEISRRKAELECGYKSIFDYCTRRLQLSEGSVARRLQVANVSRLFPQLLVALAENRISLTVAGLLAAHLREDNVDKLLSDCAGKSTRSVEEYLVGLRPKPVFKPSIRKRPSPNKESDKVQEEVQQETRQEPKQLVHQSTPSSEEQSNRSPNVLEPARPDTYNFRFSADGDFKAKFERLAEVLGVENPLTNMAEVFERAVDISLEKKDPKKKHERRLERKRKQNASSQKSRAREISESSGASASEGEKANSRYVSSEIRERLLERAGHQCQFTARDGTRCTARTGLEIEHERPFALFHSHEERFLKMLCRRHNLFQAERVYGTEFIRAKINAKKGREVSHRPSKPFSHGTRKTRPH